MKPHYNVLFLCTGNSARSIMAEGILNFKGQPQFTAFSAGSHPSGKVRPEALRQLETAHIPTSGFRSKSWDEFSTADSPKLDFVFTVCDNAANEVCPVWPGQPMTAHWRMPDPAVVEGSDEEKRKAFAETSRTLLNRIRAFVNLPIENILVRPTMIKKRTVGAIDPQSTESNGAVVLWDGKKYRWVEANGK